MQSTVHQSGNKGLGKSNVWANASLVKTVAALDEFKSGFPSEGLTTLSNKWWGKPVKDGETTEEKSKSQSETPDGGDNNKPEDGDEVKDDEVASEKQTSLVATRKRIAEEGREAIELGLHRGFGSKRPNKKDQALLFQIFNSSLPKDWVTDSS